MNKSELLNLPRFVNSARPSLLLEAICSHDDLISNFFKMIRACISNYKGNLIYFSVIESGKNLGMLDELIETIGKVIGNKFENPELLDSKQNENE